MIYTSTSRCYAVRKHKLFIKYSPIDATLTFYYINAFMIGFIPHNKNKVLYCTPELELHLELADEWTQGLGNILFIVGEYGKGGEEGP